MPWEHTHSDEELIAAVRRLAEDRGGLLTLYAFCDTFGISPSTIHVRFGGWLKFRERAGLDAERSITVPPMEIRRRRLIEKLQAAVRHFGPELTLFEFCDFAHVSNFSVQRLFGGWQVLRTAAELGPRTPFDKLTALDLMAELHRLARRLGRFPLPEDLQRHSRYTARLYRKHAATYRRVKRAYETAPPVAAMKGH